MAYLFTTETEIDQKLGAGVNVAFDTNMKQAAANRAESVINSAARYDFSTNALTLSQYSGLLSDICSSLVAIEGITYDMSGYESLNEAQSMIDVQRDIALRGLGILRDKKVVTFLQGE